MGRYVQLLRDLKKTAEPDGPPGIRTLIRRRRAACNTTYTSGPQQPLQDLNLYVQTQNLTCFRYIKGLWQICQVHETMDGFQALPGQQCGNLRFLHERSGK